MKKVLGKVPGQPTVNRSGRGSGATAPRPTHVNASSPQGVKVNPQNTGGTPLRNDWYRGDELVQYAIDKD